MNRSPAGFSATSGTCSASGDEFELPEIVTDIHGDAERRGALLNLGTDVVGQPGVTGRLDRLLLVDHRRERAWQRLVAPRGRDRRLGALVSRGVIRRRATQGDAYGVVRPVEAEEDRAGVCAEIG